jgi:WW domain-containing oxidoreductase
MWVTSSSFETRLHRIFPPDSIQPTASSFQVPMASNNQTTSSVTLKGTIILTGANGSMGYWVAYNLLQSYPSYFAIFTVRDDSSKDENTKKLQKMASEVKSAQFSIEVVDLASRSDVRSFADSVTERISTGKLPRISTVICNAFNWSLIGQKNSLDGYDLSFQVTHLSHFVLVLKVLGSVDRRGRSVFLGSKSHDPKNKDAFNKLGAGLPENLEELVAPTVDEPGEELARGFQRYANAKLANIMFMYMLNRKLLMVYMFLYPNSNTDLYVPN